MNRLDPGQEKISEPWKAIYVRLRRRLIVRMRDEATVNAVDAAIDRAWFDYFAKNATANHAGAVKQTDARAAKPAGNTLNQKSGKAIPPAAADRATEAAKGK